MFPPTDYLRSQKFPQVGPTVFLLVLATLIYGFKFPDIIVDMAWYIGRGYSILRGDGLAGPDLRLDQFDVARGPVFSLMIAIALWVNPSPDAAYWVVKLGAILLPPSVFLFCFQLQTRFLIFSKAKIGMIWCMASVICLFSIGKVNQAAVWHIDAWWILFCLWALMACIRALSNSSCLTGAVAGVLWALGYLTKEAAILYLPVLMLISVIAPSLRTPHTNAVLISVLTSALVVVGLWFLYLQLYVGEYRLLGLQGGNVVGEIIEFILTSRGPGIAPSATALVDLVDQVLNNRSNGVIPSIPLGGLLLCSWLVYGARVIKEEDARIVLLASGVALPLLAYNALQGFGFRHCLSFYIFAAPAFGYLVVKLSGWLAGDEPSRIGPVACILVSAWVCTQYAVPNSNGYSNGEFLAQTSILRVIYETRENLPDPKRLDKQYKFFSSVRAKAALTLIDADLAGESDDSQHSKTAAVMVDRAANIDVLYFYSTARLSFTDMPVMRCYRGYSKMGLEKGIHDLGKPISASIEFEGSKPRRAHILFSGLFERKLSEDGIQYFIDTGHVEELDEYLRESEAFAPLVGNRAYKKNNFQARWNVWKVDVRQLEPKLRESPKTVVTQPWPLGAGVDTKQMANKVDEFVISCLSDVRVSPNLVP